MSFENFFKCVNDGIKRDIKSRRLKMKVSVDEFSAFSKKYFKNINDKDLSFKFVHLKRERRQIMAFNKKKFKDVMRHEGVTQKDLAEKFGVDIRTVNRWLDPKYQIPSEKVRDLCVAINKIPNEFDPDWEGSTENQNVARVSAKVSSASKNGYWLMKKKISILRRMM